MRIRIAILIALGTSCLLLFTPGCKPKSGLAPTHASPPAMPVPAVVLKKAPSRHQVKFIKIAYKVIEIGTFGGDRSDADGINEHGDVTGSATPRKGFEHAFLYRLGKLRDIGTMSRQHGSIGVLINNHDQIAGVTTNDLAFFWERGRMRAIQVPRRAGEDIAVEVSGIDNDGKVIGTIDASTFYVGYSWTKGKIKFLPNKLGQETMGLAINDRGDYIWWRDGRVFLRRRNHEVIISPPNRYQFVADWLVMAINSRGDIVGNISKDEDHERPVLIQHRRTVILPLLEGFSETEGESINNHDDVVGYCRSQIDESQMHAFLYRAGKVFDLNSLIDPKSGWVLNDARGINDKGQIVGTGTFHGHKRGFILTPIAGVRL